MVCVTYVEVTSVVRAAARAGRHARAVLDDHIGGRADAVLFVGQAARPHGVRVLARRTTGGRRHGVPHVDAALDGCNTQHEDTPEMRGEYTQQYLCVWLNREA